MNNPYKTLAGAATSLCCLSIFALSNVHAAERSLPAAANIPWADDPSYLADPQLRNSDFLGALRYIPLSADPQDYFSLGGELRYQYLDYEHSLLGTRGADKGNSMLQQRIRLSGDLHLGSAFRLFVELGDNREFGADVPTRYNNDRTDVQQMFVDLSAQVNQLGTAVLRAGRFVMPLGSGRLMGLREGANVRYTYDGVKASLLLKPGTRIDAFAVHPTDIDPDEFDNQPDRTKEHSGIYATNIASPLEGAKLDLYLYSSGRDLAVYNNAVGKERRNSFGSRLYGGIDAWDYDLEAVWQSGSTAGQKIRAWGLMSDAGYRFTDLPLTPRLGVRANAFSGDKDSSDSTLNTFAPISAAPALLFTDANWFAAMNLINVGPQLTLDWTPKLTTTLQVEYLARQSTDDGIYFHPTLAPYAANQGDARHVATNTNLYLDWQVNRFAKVHVGYTHVQAGQALKDINGVNSDYLGIYTQFLF
ncbi:MAG: hypothetical protein CMK71_06865 [Pseudomonadaceae bacterium]|nr:hypothetical protein [Pseudomonadaceae bacterium]